MTDHRIEAAPAVDADIEAAFAWYESEEPDLGFEFLEEVRAVYQRILEGPFKYQELRSGIRRALTRRFKSQQLTVLNIRPAHLRDSLYQVAV